MCILTIDDEENIRNGLADNFELEGYEVKQAANGEEGLAIIAQGGIDLVITDLRMDGISGSEVVQHVTSEHPGIPIIVLTGHGSIDDATAALISAGFLNEDASSTDLLTYGKTAYLFAKEWSVKGGVMYSLTNGAQRYAFKQLVADGVFSTESDPATVLSGSDFLSLYSVCLERYGDFDIKSVSMEAE